MDARKLAPAQFVAAIEQYAKLLGDVWYAFHLDACETWRQQFGPQSEADDLDETREEMRAALRQIVAPHASGTGVNEARAKMNNALRVIRPLWNTIADALPNFRRSARAAGLNVEPLLQFAEHFGPKTLLRYCRDSLSDARITPSLNHYLPILRKRIPLLREMAEDLAEESEGDNPATADPAKTPARRTSTKRRRTGAVRALTPLQQQALELYGAHDGKIAEIANEMNVTHQTVGQHLKAAWRKLPELAPKKAPVAGRARRIPIDSRGQVNLSSDAPGAPRRRKRNTSTN